MTSCADEAAAAVHASVPEGASFTPRAAERQGYAPPRPRGSLTFQVPRPRTGIFPMLQGSAAAAAHLPGGVTAVDAPIGWWRQPCSPLLAGVQQRAAPIG